MLDQDNSTTLSQYNVVCLVKLYLNRGKFILLFLHDKYSSFYIREGVGG